MSNRTIRRSVVVLAFAALLAPATGLHAAPTRPAPAMASSTAPHHNPVVQFLLGMLSGMGVHVDAGILIDGNG